ncbi:YceI family protein [Mycolicibacterium sp. P1-5]|uniref:YceI family protein n=1 Tax=Mycolicibacterium sp. P1-5 TaxID=2024617 RepID=UPI0011ED0B00|nr:YceI family protein [Mycolicibacterium sp. P1-5]KAA0109000.1 YceI family protein [Mycolicibacterium sp. P1-5]
MSALQALLNDPGAVGTWQLVPERSTLRFKNKTFWGLATVTGTFGGVSSTGQVGANGVVSGRLDIHASSVKTGIGKRDEHLRSADFFDVEKHPEISVEVAALKPTGTDTADLTATLTIRGVTQPLPLAATITPLGDGAVQLTTEAAVDRTKWGVSGNMIGMMPATTTLLADVVFAKA